MSLMVDQSWVNDWKGRPTDFQKDHIVSWLTLQKKEWHPLLEKFPPFCIVKAKAGKVLEIPCPFSVAIVYAYYEDGTLALGYEPGLEPDELTPVSPDDLEVVGFWKHLDHHTIHHLLH